jgi:hypothetical protein
MYFIIWKVSYVHTFLFHCLPFRSTCAHTCLSGVIVALIPYATRILGEVRVSFTRLEVELQIPYSSSCFIITKLASPNSSFIIIPHYSYIYTLLLILYHASLQLWLRPSTHPLSYLITAISASFYSSFIIPHYSYA